MNSSRMECSDLRRDFNLYIGLRVTYGNYRRKNIEAMCVIKTIKSIKNDNIYHLDKDKIKVVCDSKISEISLPFDTSRYMYYLQFADLYYIDKKLFAVVATGGPYDVRFELDEEKVELIGEPIQTY